jgi:hypothetical protein
MLAATGSVRKSAALIGTQTSRLYELRKYDEKFDEAWEKAEDIAAAALEAEAWRRATQGVPETVVSGGKIMRHDDGTPMMIRRHSDRLLELLLRAHLPEKYREHSAIHLYGQNGGPIEIETARDRLAAKLEAMAERLRARELGAVENAADPQSLAPPAEPAEQAGFALALLAAAKPARSGG